MEDVKIQFTKTIVSIIRDDIKLYGWTTKEECFNRLMEKSKNSEILNEQKEFLLKVFDFLYDKNLMNNEQELEYLINYLVS